jgi:hypothetical protein
LRDKRTLSQLQQLHWRVASDVLKSTQLCNTPDNQASETVEQVNAWKVRLETILDNAVESVSQPGDLSHGSETSKAMPVPNGPPATFAGSSVSASAATIGSNTGRP